MKNLVLISNLLFLISLVGCNGAEFSGSRSKGSKYAPPVIICDDEKGCDPSTDPKPKDPIDDPTCTVADCLLPVDPCDKLPEDYENRPTEECEVPCEGDYCSPPGGGDDDNDPGQSDDDPSQSADSSERWYR